MNTLIDYHDGSFAEKLSDTHEEDIDRLNDMFEDPDYVPIDRESLVFEYVGDEDVYIKAYARYIMSPFANYGKDCITFTDDAVKHVAENLDFIDNEMSRMYIAIACADRLGDEELKTRSKARLNEIMTAYAKELVAKRKHTVRVPKACIDGEDCYKRFKEHTCPESTKYASLTDYLKEKCPLEIAEREANETGIPLEVIRI